MKMKVALVIILMGLMILVYLCYFSFSNWNRDRLSNIQKRNAESMVTLSQVNERIGKDFENWQSLREYVWCELLTKGMTRQEIDKAFEKIGERGKIYNKEYGQIDFINEYIDENLAPIILSFDDIGMDAKLVSWHVSTESNFGDPRASCEADD